MWAVQITDQLVYAKISLISITTSLFSCEDTAKSLMSILVIYQFILISHDQCEIHFEAC